MCAGIVRGLRFRLRAGYVPLAGILNSKRSYPQGLAQKQARVYNKTMTRFTKETAKEAGRNGGKKTLKLYGFDHMAKIGAKGGAVDKPMLRKSKRRSKIKK